MQFLIGSLEQPFLDNKTDGRYGETTCVQMLHAFSSRVVCLSICSWEPSKLPLSYTSLARHASSHLPVQLNIIGREETALAAVLAEPPVIVWEFLRRRKENC